MGGSAVGPGSDIYALGVIVFRMLTGRVPFDAPTSMGIVIAHLNQQAPTPRTIRPDLPTAVEQVVLKALAKEPADRYPSAGALAEALSMAWGRPDMLHYTPTVPHPVSPVNPDVHNMQTVADQALPQPAVPVAATTGATPAPPDEVPPPPPVVPSSVRRGRAMGWLVGVLGLLLLCGAVYGITQLTGGGAAAPAVMPSPTDTPTTMPPTFTSVPPTSVPTATAVPPTATAVPPTNTPLPPTDTPVPPTPTLFPTTAPLPTFTPVPPTFTLVPPTPEPTTGAEVQDPPLVEKTPPGLERAPGQRRTPENGPPERNTSLSPYPAPDA
jgi:serine/threonine-protein kinase